MKVLSTVTLRVSRQLSKRILSGRNNIFQQMAGEFIRKKWTMQFGSNDLNKDGVLTMEDANLFTERFIEHHNMTGEKAKQLKASFQAIWNSLFLFDLDQMDLKTYLRMMEKEFVENRARFIERHRQAERNIVDLFDVNNDGLLSEEEYVTACKCWGVESLDRKYVQSYPHIKPGYISKEAFADSWIAFNTNDDVNNSDMEKPVMFGFGMIDHM